MNQKEILIGKYIIGELEGIELEQFEKSLKDNSSLAEEVKFYKTVDDTLAKDYRLKNAIDENERKEFEQILSNLRNEEANDFGMAEKEKTPKIIKLLPYVSLTAVAAALLLFFFFPFQTKYEKLANEYYPEPKFETNATLSSNVAPFEEAFKNGEYRKALDLVKGKTINDLNLRFYIGVCQFKLDEIDAAISTWEYIVKNTGNQNLKYKSNWYLALTYLGKGNKQAAISFLKDQSSDSVYSKKARELLDKL